MTPISELFQQVFSIFSFAYKYISLAAPIWAPVLFVFLARKYWLQYKQTQFINKLDFILLEIKLPREVLKTPQAMEIVLQSMYQTSSGNTWEKWTAGKVRVWFTLEIISDQGNVRFLIRTPKKFRKLIEAHIYANYPNTEVTEVPDYVGSAPYMHEHHEWELWGCEYALTKPDPYPIKTYVDYGLDKSDQDEETKVDPLATLIEYMGSFGRDQYLWFQINIQPTKERFPVVGSYFDKQDWKKEAKRIVSELKEAAVGGEDGKGKPSKRESEIIHAIERSTGKPGFDCGLRSIYIAKSDRFDPTLITGVAGLLAQFGSQDLNGFKPTHSTDFDYPWEDYKDIRLNKKKHHIFDAYIKRAYFYGEHAQTPYVLNSEELATIWHFPGRVAESPAFTRIDSRKSEPPSNLPT